MRKTVAIFSFLSPKVLISNFWHTYALRSINNFMNQPQRRIREILYTFQCLSKSEMIHIRIIASNNIPQFLQFLTWAVKSIKSSGCYRGMGPRSFSNKFLAAFKCLPQSAQNPQHLISTESLPTVFLTNFLIVESLHFLFNMETCS